MRPTVSVVIPCYNAARTLPRAVASVRAQRVPGVEIIVVDDASVDGTRASVKPAPDLVLVDLAANGGVSRARNAGIAAARGDHVAFLDADDQWLPGKLARQLAMLEARPETALVATAGVSMRPGRQALPVFPPKNVPVTGAEAWRALLAYPFILTSSVVVRAGVLRRVGGFDETLPVAEDQDLWIRIALAEEIDYLDEVLVVKHEQRQSLSNLTPLGGARYALPVVMRHAEANRHRLSRRELQAIIGRRLSLEGRNAYYSGLYGPGLRMLGRAILMPHEPLSNALFLVKNAPPGRWLRRILSNSTAEGDG